MSLLNSVLKIFVGDKAKKDIKEIQPIVDKIKALENTFQQLSLDELRAKTEEFKSKIKEARAEKDAEITRLANEASEITDIDKKEEYYDAIDRLEDEAYELTEKVLHDILPEAFANIKETARRFANNESLKVIANNFDRELSGTKEYVTLEGDFAIWQNKWDAAGKEITWDMVHYDVQLIGGSVMHQGKIAEMQTGEGKTLVATPC